MLGIDNGEESGSRSASSPHASLAPRSAGGLELGGLGADDALAGSIQLVHGTAVPPRSPVIVPRLPLRGLRPGSEAGIGRVPGGDVTPGVPSPEVSPLPTGRRLQSRANGRRLQSRQGSEDKEKEEEKEGGSSFGLGSFWVEGLRSGLDATPQAGVGGGAS